MEIYHIGPKNFPPSHGGVEKFVYDIVTESKQYKSKVYVEWNQTSSDRVIPLEKGLFRQIRQIRRSVSNKNNVILHFHKEVFILHSIILMLQGYKCVHTIHGCSWRIKHWGLYRILFYILNLLGCFFLKNIVYVSEADCSYFNRFFFWKKLNYIPNGVSINNYFCSEDTDKCVYIGRISPEKNLLNLIKLFENSKKTLTIYGPLNLKDENFNKLFLNEVNKCKNIKYLGAIKYDEVFIKLKEYNTFYNISLVEGMPVSVLEAASVNLNLVLSNIPQHIDLNFPNVKYINPKNLIEDNTLCKKNNGSNKTHLEENYSIKKTVKMYNQIYDSLK